MAEAAKENSLTRLMNATLAEMNAIAVAGPGAIAELSMLYMALYAQGRIAELLLSKVAEGDPVGDLEATRAHLRSLADPTIDKWASDILGPEIARAREEAARANVGRG